MMIHVRPDDPFQNTGVESTFFTHYVRAVHFAVESVTGVGFGTAQVTSTVERIFCCFIMLLGVALFGFIIGKLVPLLKKNSFIQQKHASEINRLLSIMSYLDIPQAYQKEALEFKTFSLSRSIAAMSNILDKAKIPKSLKEEVLTYVKISTLKGSPLFGHVSEHCLQELASLMQDVVSSPKQAIIRAGDTAEAMYFVLYGELNVVNPTGETVAVLNSQATPFFGEIGILIENMVRTASVIASSYCSLYKLSKHDIRALMNYHPDLKKSILEETQRRMALMNLDKNVISTHIDEEDGEDDLKIEAVLDSNDT